MNERRVCGRENELGNKAFVNGNGSPGREGGGERCMFVYVGGVG